MAASKIKEVTLFACGDSTQVSFWSNVPYMFCTTLESRGIRVNHVDISPKWRLEQLWNRTFGRLHTLLNGNTSYDYFRSLTNFVNTRQRIRKAVEQNASSDLYIFMTFSFSAAGFTEKPSVQLCDWTFEHLIDYHKERAPDFFEKRCIAREESQIAGSKAVFALFPGTTEQLREKHRHSEAHYVGPVVNSIVEPPSESEALERKKNFSDIVFIGSSQYKPGADLLIAALPRVREEFPDAKIHIIGLTKGDFESLPGGVECHGYLDKGDDAQRDLYYDILGRSRLLVNTTPRWGAFSGTAEAMYHYTPVIVSPFDEFKNCFGESLDFGTYHDDDSDSPLAEEIVNTMGSPHYDELCRNARRRAAGFSWDRFIDKFLEVVEK